MAKRGQNEGSIYKRTDGRWAAAINLGYAGGKLKRKTFYGKTRTEVQAKLTEALSDKQKGLPVVIERQTVGQFLERWLEDCVKPSVRPNTYYSYEQHVRLYLKPELGQIQLSKLSPQHIQTLMNSQLKVGRSPRLVQYLRTVLRCALTQALKWNLVARNVATLVDSPRYKKTEVVPFTVEQVHTFLESIKGDRLEAVFRVALSLGLREGEILGLRWQDVDFQSGVVRVTVALQRIERKLQLVDLKTQRSRRTLPIPETTANALRAHRIKQLEDKMLAGDLWKETGLVFTTSIGTPLYARNVLRSFHRLLKRAGIPRQGFHNLRHSCASLLLAHNVSPRTLMDILGHSNISLTMNTYAHVMPGMLCDAANLMDSVLTMQR
jgi:integrase